jgi:hypothetical protein
VAWTCQRRASGRKCGHVNGGRLRKCGVCGKPRPARKRPAHMAALDIPYEAYVAISGREVCGICGAPPSATRRLDRDHDHATGLPRGCLCHGCNRLLSGRVTPEWLRAAAAYLERSADPGGTMTA